MMIELPWMRGLLRKRSKKCIDHIQKNKVAGLDGIPVEFY
jgi:hypothetical protein